MAIRPPVPKVKTTAHAEERWKERGDGRDLRRVVIGRIRDTLRGGIKPVPGSPELFIMPLGNLLFAICELQPPWWVVVTVMKKPYYDPERVKWTKKVAGRSGSAAKKT